MGNAGRHSSGGLSLVELLVALALGVVLSFAAVNLLLRSKLSYLESDDFDRSVEKLFQSDVNKKWQEHMEKYFDKSKSDILGPEIVMLEKIWQLEE